MNRKYARLVFLTLSLVFSILGLSAQPPCATNPIADDFCATATPICNLNGYCGNTSAFYTNAVSPTNSTNETYTPLGDIFCATIQNNSWLKFIADSTVAIFDVWCSNCQINRGIQMQIYTTTDCYNYTSVSNCWNPGSPTNGQIVASGLTPGDVYYFMIDGAMGDVCDYVIACNIGVTVSPTVSPDQTICLGSGTQVTATGGLAYTWSSFPPDPALAGQQNNATINVNPSVTTTYTALILNPGLNTFCTTDTTLLSSVVSINDLSAQLVAIETAHCGHPDGSITVNGSGGSGTYAYSWNTTPPQTTATASGLVPGQYTCTVTNDGCSVSSTYTVPDLPGPTLNLASLSNAHCGQASGQASMLAGSGTPPYTYVWNSTPPQTSLNLQGVFGGVYTLTVTDSNACTATYTVTIADIPGPAVSLSALPVVCANQSPFLLSGGSPPGGTYSGNGITGNIFDPGLAGSGSVQVLYTYSDPFGCSGSAAGFITLNPVPAVSFTPLAALCADASAFSLSGGSPAGGTYFGTGVLGGNFDPAASGAGSFAVGYAFADTTGCSDTAYQTILVRALPQVSLSLQTDYCTSDSIQTLGGGLPAGGSYSGNGVVNGQFNPNALGSGSYPVLYTFTDTFGCTDTAAQVIEVHPLPIAFMIGGGGIVCEGSGGTDIVLDSSQTGLIYHLLFNGQVAGFPFTGTGEPLVFPGQSMAGTYTINAMNPQTGCFNVMSGTAEIKVLPSPDVALGEDLYLCDLPEIVLDAGTYEDTVVYLWQDGSAGRRFSVAEPGLYYVKVFLGNCYGIDSVDVKDCSDLWLPNVFTPNGDQKNERFKPEKNGEIASYFIRVFDRWGKLVYSSDKLEEGWDGTNFNNGQSCSEGVYFYVASYVAIIYPQPNREKKLSGSVTLLR